MASAHDGGRANCPIAALFWPVTGVDHRRPVSKSDDDGTFNALQAVGRIRTEGVLLRSRDRFLRR
jgi:hypothetical protein